MEDIIMCYGPVVSVSEGWMVAEENNVYTLLKWDSFYQEWDDVAHRSALRPLTGDERKGFADVWISRHQGCDEYHPKCDDGEDEEDSNNIEYKEGGQ